MTGIMEMIFRVGELTCMLVERGVCMQTRMSYVPFLFLHSPRPDAYLKNSEPHARGPYRSTRYLICGLSKRQPYVPISLQLCFHTDIFSDPPLGYSLPRSNLSFSSHF